MTSSPLSSPTSHRGMHPSLLSPTSLGHSGSLHSPISTLSSPMNGLGSPFSVISSPMGPHSMVSPGMGYGPSVSPQVGPHSDTPFFMAMFIYKCSFFHYRNCACISLLIGSLLIQRKCARFSQHWLIFICGITDLNFNLNVLYWHDKFIPLQSQTFTYKNKKRNIAKC